MSRWNVDEIENAKSLLEEGKTYDEISLCLNRSAKSVKLKLNNIGMKFSDFQKPKEIKKCQCCGNDILGVGILYCSSSCAAKINNSLFPKRTPIDESKTKQYNKRIRIPKPLKVCLHCGNPCIKKYCSFDCQHKFSRIKKLEDWKSGTLIGFSGKTKQIKKFIRAFLLEKYQYRCCKCGWNEKHPITGNHPLEVNHIDGDAENCKEDNLEIICPNCHSLTYNFRALNKDSKRIRK
jgi:hypothetical protein